MDLQKLATMPIRFSRQQLLLAATLLALLAGLLMLAGRGQNPPRFVLDQATQQNVRPFDEYSWRKASDWMAGRKYAVLTFDDGPYGHGVDEQILHILHRHHAHAIFFLVCDHINDANSYLLRRFEGEGHLIGNHSLNHLRLDTLQDLDLRQQIESCSTRLADLTGHRPYYFRPPFGATSPHVKHFIEMAGMHQMLWDANSGDTWQTKPEQILYLSHNETGNHSILLMHDKPTTAAALDQTLTDLERQGFQFVLPEQLPPDTAAD
jgi:peptidoglycan-N-acetylglucosamine deacetylase